VAHEGKGGDGSAGQIPTADGVLGARESYGEVWPRKAVHDFGGLGVDERGKGRTGTGRWLAFILKEIGSVARVERGKKGWSTWALSRGGGRRKGGPWHDGR
jgi:hypothetical protein